jgi:autotransporter-associated beta strand protein
MASLARNSTAVNSIHFKRMARLSAAIAGVLALGVPTVFAANTQFIYNGPGGTTSSPADGGSFSTDTNWNNGLGPAPASAPTTELDFSDGSATYTATDDISGALNLNEIQFNNSQSGTAMGTIAAGAGNSLNFMSSGGVSATIMQNGTGAFSLNIPIGIDPGTTLTFGGLENSGALANGNGTLTINGQISGSSNVIFGGSSTVSTLGVTTAPVGINGGYGTINLTGSNSYTGNTFLSAGTLTLDFTSDNGTNNSRISTANLTLSGGTLNLIGSANNATVQTVSGTTLNGRTAIVVNNGAGQTATLNLGGITRTIGGAIDISGTGTVTTTTTNTPFTGGTSPATIIGGWATVGGGANWAVSSNVLGTNPIVPLTSYTTSGTPLTSNGDIDMSSGTVTTSGALTVNSLRFNSAATTFNTGGALTVASGGILMTPSASGAVSINNNTLTSGNGTDLIVNQYNTANALTVASVISGAVGLTKTGPGTLILSSTANTFTGDVYVDGGTLQISGSNGSATAGPFGISTATAFKHVVLTNGGTVRINTTYNDNVQSATVQGQVFFIGAGGGTLDVASGQTLTLDDGSGAGVATTNAELQGFGDLTFKSTGTTGTNTGTVSLSNGTSNFSNFTGQIFIASNVTVTFSNGVDGLGSTTAGTTILSGGVLNMNGQANSVGAEPLTVNGTGIGSGGALINSSATSVTASGPVTLASASSIGGAGVFVLSNTVSGPGALTKIGAGTVTLGGANTYTGGTIISAGTLVANNASALSNGPITVNAGTLSLASASIVSTGTVTLNGGILSLSNGNTLTSGTVTLNGGTLIGGASSTVTNAVASGTGAATIAPGGPYAAGGSLATIGTLNIGSLSLTPNTTLGFDLTTPAGSNDLVAVSALDGLTASGGKIPIAFGQVPTATGTYHLISFNQDGAGGITANSFTAPSPGGRIAYSLQLDPGSGNQQFIDLIVQNNATPITANFIGTTTPASWTTAANWSSNPTVPGVAGDVVTFNNAASSPGVVVVTLDGAQSVGSLTFNNTGTTSFNIAPGVNAQFAPALTFDNTPNSAPATLVNSSNNNTISAPVTLVSPINVTVTGATNGAPNVLAISGNMNGAGALTLTASTTGTLLLSGTNSSFTGGVTVAGGTVQTGSATALGTAPASVSSGATLDLFGQTIANNLTLNGTGSGGIGALINSGSAGGTDSGTVNLASATTIGGNGPITLSGVVSGAGALTKTGLGNLTLSAINTDTGAITINGGTITIANANGATGDVQAATITVNSGGSLVLQKTDAIGYTAGRNALTINSGGTVLNSTAGTRVTVQNTINMAGGTLAGTSVGDASTGAFSFDAAPAVIATSDAAGNPAIISCNVSLQLAAGVGFTVNRGAAVAGTAPDLLISGPLTNYATTVSSFNKNGNGILTLTGASTFTSPTNVNLGTLSLNRTSGSVLGATKITVGTGAAITSTAGNATLLVQGNNTVGTAAGGSMTISGGDGSTIGQGTLSLVDGNINTLTLTNLTAAASSLTLGSATNPAMVNLELGTASGSSDKIVVGTTTNQLVVNAGGIVNGTSGVGAVLNIFPTGAIVNGTYTLLSYASQSSGAAGGGFAFSNGTQTETLNGATLTLTNSATAETLNVTTTAGTVPATAYFQGSVDANWNTIDATTAVTNFTLDSAGTSNTLQLPGATTDVHFYATNANTANLATTLGQNFTIQSLTLDGGALSQNVSIASGGSGTNTLTITPTAAANGIVLNNGAGSLTITAPFALGGAQTWTNNSGSTLTVSGPSLAGGTFALIVTGTGNTSISAPITGSGLLTKNGAGTLTLGGLNSNTGGTLLLGGAIQTATDSAMSAGTLAFGAVNTTGVVSLNLAGNQNVAAFSVLSNNTTANTVSIASGKTLTLTNGLTVGYDATTFTPLAVENTRLAVSGAGGITISAGTLTVGVSQATANAANGSTGTVDLSAMTGPFTANVTAFNVGFGFDDAGIFTLGPGVNTITTPLLQIGHSNGNNGDGVNSLLTLGTGTNVLRADTINIGLSKVSANVQFASQAANSPGTLTITNANGSGASAITVGSQNGTNTGATIIGTLDLRGHLSNVTAGAVVVGNNNNSGGSGFANGVLDFDTGIFNAASLAVGEKSSSGTGSNILNVFLLNGGAFNVSGATTISADTGTASGTSGVTTNLNISGGTLTTGTLVGATKSSATNTGTALGNINVSGTGALIVAGGTFSLATEATAGTATGTLNITGGSVTTNADITDGGGTANTTITLNGGSLNMLGHKIGTATQSIDTLNFQAGTLSNVGEINNGAPLNKTSSGTLVLAGSSAYTGGTNINSGIVQVQGPENPGVSGPLGKSGSIAFGGGTLQYSPTNNADYSSRFPNVSQPMSIDTNGQNVTFAANLMTGSSGSLTLTDSAATPGSLTLSGVSSYSGATTVTTGVLKITGAVTNSNVTVAANATLGGSGTVGTNGINLAVNAGGSIWPSVPSTTTPIGHPLLIDGNTSLTGDQGAKFVVTLASPTLNSTTHFATGYDQMVMDAAGASLDLQGFSTTGAQLVINDNAYAAIAAKNDVFWIVDGVGGSSINGTFGNAPTTVTGSSGIVYNITYGTGLDSSDPLGSGEYIKLTVNTPVPEPSSLLLAGLGAAGLLIRRRRKNL